MLESKNVSTLGLRGDALLHLHRYDEALECCERVLLVDENNTNVHDEDGVDENDDEKSNMDLVRRLSENSKSKNSWASLK